MAWLATLLTQDRARISPALWTDAWLGDEPVGTCDRCHSVLHVVETDDQLPILQTGPVNWYRAKCVDCGREVCSGPSGVLSKRQKVTWTLPIDYVAPTRPGEREAS